MAQIRQSAGKLHGLGLAVFAGLLFPLLLLDALIFFGCAWALTLYFPPYKFQQHPQFAYFSYEYQQNPWIACFWLLSLGVIGGVNFFILRGVWQAVKPAAETSHQKKILAAIHSWLALMDGGNYGASWDAASPRFHRRITRELWMEHAQNARQPQGKTISRQVRTAHRFLSNYTVKFDTAYASLKAAVETVIFTRDHDGQWRPIAYWILPAYAEESRLLKKGREALFFAGLGCLSAVGTLCFWPRLVPNLAWGTPVAALLGIFIGLEIREHRRGRSAIALGSTALALWLAALVAVNLDSGKSFDTGQTHFPEADKKPHQSPSPPTTVTLSGDSLTLAAPSVRDTNGNAINLATADTIIIFGNPPSALTNVDYDGSKTMANVNYGQFENAQTVFTASSNTPLSYQWQFNATNSSTAGAMVISDPPPMPANPPVAPADGNDDETLLAQPPVVVETFPVSGARNVTPGVVEIRVRFSQEMTDESWSWSSVWNNSMPQIISGPHYGPDHRTCSLKVRLKPSHTYGYWLNSNQHFNFKDRAGQPAVPYLLIFQTKPQ